MYLNDEPSDVLKTPNCFWRSKGQSQVSEMVDPYGLCALQYKREGIVPLAFFLLLFSGRTLVQKDSVCFLISTDKVMSLFLQINLLNCRQLASIIAPLLEATYPLPGTGKTCTVVSQQYHLRLSTIFMTSCLVYLQYRRNGLILQTFKW